MKFISTFILITILISGCAATPPSNIPVVYVDIENQNSNLDKLTSLDRKQLAKYLDHGKAQFVKTENLPDSSDLGDKEWLPPKIIKMSYAIYDVNFRTQEGIVYVVILISEEGKVVDAGVSYSTNPNLEQSALLSVKQWEFTPAFLGGKPCKSVLTAPIRFTNTRPS